VDFEGRPNSSEMSPSNTADVTSHAPIVKRMRQAFGLREMTLVAERGWNDAAHRYRLQCALAGLVAEDS
jgi:hypothetical protein